MFRRLKNIDFRYRVTTLAAINVWLMISFVTIFSLSQANLQGDNKPFKTDANAVTPTATPKPVQVWAPQFMGFGTTGTQSDYRPEMFPIAGFNYYNYPNKKSEVDLLHAKGVKVIVYINGSFKNEQDQGPSGDGTGSYPESSYAHTANNEHIYPNDFRGNVLMNPRDSTWRQSLVNKCRVRLSQANFDGCYFDTIGIAPVTASYVSPSVAIDPNKDKPWTEQDYLDEMVSEMQAVKTGNPGTLIYGNGLAKGSAYFEKNTKSLFSTVGGLDGCLAEIFVKDPLKAPNDTEAAWKQNVDMLLDAAAKNKTVLVTVKAWENPPASRAQKDVWHKFALATFLLGSSDKAYFNFTYENTTTSPSTYNSWWSTDIGTPTDSYHKDGSVYIRNFTKVKVVVNPTDSAVTYQLGGNYTALGSTQTISSITLPARTGEVLSAVAVGGGGTQSNTQQTGSNTGTKDKKSTTTGGSSGATSQDTDANSNSKLTNKPKGNAGVVNKLFGNHINSKNATIIALLVPLIFVLIIWGGVMLWHRGTIQHVFNTVRSKFVRENVATSSASLVKTHWWTNIFRRK